MKGGPVFPQRWIHCANIKIFHGAWHALSSLSCHFPREHYQYPDYLLVFSSPSHPSSPDYETLRLWENGCTNAGAVKERQLHKWYQHWVMAYCHQGEHQSRTMTCILKISFEMRNLDTSGAIFNQTSLSLCLIQLLYFYLKDQNSLNSMSAEVFCK